MAGAGNSMVGKTVLAGHGLQHEGIALDERGMPAGTREGTALCACGERSPVLPSTSQRQKWHRAHKDAIRQQQGH